MSKELVNIMENVEKVLVKVGNVWVRGAKVADQELVMVGEEYVISRNIKTIDYVYDAEVVEGMKTNPLMSLLGTVEEVISAGDDIFVKLSNRDGYLSNDEYEIFVK